MHYTIKLKNADANVLVDVSSFEYFENDEYFKKLDVLNNLRKHANTGAPVFQKWLKNLDGSAGTYQETVYLHKAIAEKFISRPSADHKFVVHINRNHLDCRIENLQWVTRSQLCRLRKYESVTGYRGVYKEKKRFRARAHVDGTQHDLGSYETAEEAATAYNNFIKEKGLYSHDINVFKDKNHKIRSLTNNDEKASDRKVIKEEDAKTKSKAKAKAKEDASAAKKKTAKSK
ncbi:MAG: HNH endonuclease [Bacteroidia bacterium]